MFNLKTILFFGMSVLGLVTFRHSAIEQEEKYIRTELYFGLSRPDGGFISEGEWVAFCDTVISKTFVNGATILNSDGMWLQDGVLIKEDSRMVIYFSRLYEMTDEFSASIDTLREKYKRYYKQQAVLRTDEFVNASF